MTQLTHTGETKTKTQRTMAVILAPEKQTKYDLVQFEFANYPDCNNAANNADSKNNNPGKISDDVNDNNPKFNIVGK